MSSVLSLMTQAGKSRCNFDTFKVKGIGGVHLDFYKLILFYRVLSELSDIFNRLKKFKVTFEIYSDQVRDRNRFLMKGAN